MEKLGNPELPPKFRHGRGRKKVSPRGVSGSDMSFGKKPRSVVIAAALVIIGAIGVSIPLFLHQPASKSVSASISKSTPFPAPTIPEKSIAVLPFENRSDDKQNAYFADGVQNEILTDLAKIAEAATTLWLPI
jgi:hypothetical protein